ncbi:MAG TPA: SPASM domain-containing protein [Thermoanaerobacter sp.]|nr:SPASM domain-containing protein [Thermoanaerobacter sp.]
MGELKKNIEKYADVLKTKELLTRKVNTLSMGQKERVTITASLLHEPELLILDEPSNGLDIESRILLTSAIKTLREEIKKVNEKIWNIEGKYKGIKIMGDVPKSIEDQKVPGCNINVGFEIQPDGNVLPCRIFEQRVDDKIILGNIKSQNIFEIWNSEKAKRIRSYSKRLSKKVLCTKCEFARFCSTNYCIAENFLKFDKFIPSEEDLNKCKI